MVKSMTGYGKTTFTLNEKTVVIEIKSLNSKQIEISPKIASLYREKENTIRTLITSQLERGRIDVYIYMEKSTPQTIHFNHHLIKTYYDELQKISQSIGNEGKTDILTYILSMPDVMMSSKDILSEEDWQITEKAINEVCQQVNQFRMQEGEALSKDIAHRIRMIDAMIDEISPLESLRTERIKEKMKQFFQDFQCQVQFDAHRFEQELIYYLEKLDITEEKVRLRQHCCFFLETLHEEKSNGKKLGFIMQECGREVNTIGSKANDFHIQQIVVRMKDEIEKIKEQLFNIL